MMLRVCCITVLFAAASFAAEWNYDPQSSHGPSNWEDFCNAEASKQQSPINIQTDEAEKEDFDDFTFEGYSGVGGTLSNNGHTVVLSLDASANARMSGGGLGSTFKLAQFHFHWGTDNTKGSEHTVNGNSYPLEVHFVHYNTKYADLGTAVPESDGLAVLGFFFEVGSEESYKAITDGIEDIKSSETATYAVNNLNLLDMMPGRDGTFYRYPGGLTTPPCTESVTWTVFKQPIKITSDQLAMFRDVVDDAGKGAGPNYRPVQPLHARKVKTNNDDTSSGSSQLGTCLALLVASLLGLLFVQ